MNDLQNESGKTQGKRNVEIFERFIACMDDDRWVSILNAKRTRIVKKKLRELCGIGENPFKQNKQLIRRLRELENELQSRGILVSDENRKIKEFELMLTKSELTSRIEKQFDDVKKVTEKTIRMIQETELKMHRMLSGEGGVDV